jgi:hypothetical protein
MLSTHSRQRSRFAHVLPEAGEPEHQSIAPRAEARHGGEVGRAIGIEATEDLQAR